MIDTDAIRKKYEILLPHLEPYVEGAEYNSMYYVVLKLCDEVDRLRSETDATLLWNSTAYKVEELQEKCNSLQDDLKKQASFHHAMIVSYDGLLDYRYTMIKQREADAFRLLAERDEARTIARRLWREKQTEKVRCPQCGGIGHALYRNAKYIEIKSCNTCHGTGKVTR